MRSSIGFSTKQTSLIRENNMALIILMGTFDRDDVDTQRVAAALADAMGVFDEEAMAHLEEIYKNPPPVRDPDSKEMDIVFF